MPRHGAHIAYHDDGDGPAVLLLHGWLCPSDMWRHQVEALIPGYRTLVLDFPAHGRSRGPHAPEVYSEDAFARLAVDVLHDAGLESAALIGFSMGGGVALNIAQHAPDAVDGLFLADTGGGSSDVAGHRAAMGQLARRITPETFPAVVDDLLTTDTFSTFAGRDRGSYDEMRGLMLDCDPTGIAAVVAGVHATRAPISERLLEQIRVPAHVLVGELDRQCAAEAQQIAQRLPNAALTTLAGAGHMTPLEAPRAFNQALLGFLSECVEAAGTR